MIRSKIDEILKKAEAFEQLTEHLSPSTVPPPFMEEQPQEQVLYRAQPKGRGLAGHTSGLAYEKVNGIFAFETPEQLFDTYSWLHMRKNIDDYEMITFLGQIVDRPVDSEGVVVNPVRIISRIPLRKFVEQVGMPLEQAS